MEMKNKKQSGFTLIELLVVIAIIGLLASVVLVALNGARAKSRDAKRVGDINQMAKAMELYFSDKNSYPTISGGVNFSSSPSIGQPNITPTYLTKLPTAPLPSDGNSCGSSGSTGNGVNDYYMYQNVSGGQLVTTTYIITFCLGNQTGPLAPGPHTLTQSGIQ